MIGMNLLWAASYPIFKFITESISSSALATLRFGLSAVLLLAFWPFLGRQNPRWSDLPRLAFMGLVVFCAAPRLQIEGVHLGKAGDTSLLMALDPLITAIAAAVFLRERVPVRRWWGCALGMIGVILLSRVWTGETAPVRGLWANLLFILSFFCEAGYSVLGKPILHRVSPMKILAVGAACGTIANILLDWIFDHGSTRRAVAVLNSTQWLLIVYLVVICTVVGYTLWYVVIRETEVNVVGLTVLVQPISGFFLAVIWLHEPVHIGQLWGSLAIVAGLAVGLRRTPAFAIERPATTPAPAREPAS